MHTYVQLRVCIHITMFDLCWQTSSAKLKTKISGKNDHSNTRQGTERSNASSDARANANCDVNVIHQADHIFIIWSWRGGMSKSIHFQLQNQNRIEFSLLCLSLILLLHISHVITQIHRAHVVFVIGIYFHEIVPTRWARWSLGSTLRGEGVPSWVTIIVISMCQHLITSWQHRQSSIYLTAHGECQSIMKYKLFLYFLQFFSESTAQCSPLLRESIGCVASLRANIHCSRWRTFHVHVCSCILHWYWFTTRVHIYVSMYAVGFYEWTSNCASSFAQTLRW